MKAEIISVGTELLLGEIVNTDASYIAAQLPLLGIELYHIVTVGDNRYRIIEALQQASSRSDIIITTGGLGPTQDDITREAMAEFLHEEIHIDAACLEELSQFFRRRNIPMSANNQKQAGIIPSASFILNSRGTAPGWWIAKNGHTYITLPGPTGELKDMWLGHVLPILKELPSRHVIMSRTLKTFGLPESQVDEMVGTLLQRPNPTLGIYAKPDGIHLRITVKAASESAALQDLDKFDSEIREKLQDSIWGIDDQGMEEVATGLIVQQGLTISTIETDTGGLLAAGLRNHMGKGDHYRGGLILPDDKSSHFCGFDKIWGQYDTINADINSAMAARIRQISGADIGISIDIDSGVDAGTNVTMGIDYRGEAYQHTRNFPGKKAQVRQRAVTATLFELIKVMMNGGKHASDY